MSLIGFFDGPRFGPNISAKRLAAYNKRSVVSDSPFEDANVHKTPWLCCAGFAGGRSLFELHHGALPQVRRQGGSPHPHAKGGSRAGQDKPVLHREPLFESRPE